MCIRDSAIFSRFGLVLVLLLLQAFALFSLLQWFGELLPHYFGGTLLVTCLLYTSAFCCSVGSMDSGSTSMVAAV